MQNQHLLMSQAPKPLLDEKERSRFLSGLLGGIGPRAAHSNSMPLDSIGNAAALQMPKPPQMRPLPPLPHVPTIAEFQRTISGSRPVGMTSPLEIPRLEVLPLLGVNRTPQVSLPLATLQPSLQLQFPWKSQVQHSAWIWPCLEQNCTGYALHNKVPAGRLTTKPCLQSNMKGCVLQAPKLVYPSPLGPASGRRPPAFQQPPPPVAQLTASSSVPAQAFAPPRRPSWEPTATPQPSAPVQADTTQKAKASPVSHSLHNPMSLPDFGL